MNTQGRKEITEAVVIAALCTLASGLITWGIESLKTSLKKEEPVPEPVPEEKKPARRSR